jgi:suppressor of ftsI
MRTSRRTFFKTVGGSTAALHFGAACSPGGAEDPRVVPVTLTVDWLRTTMGGLDVRLRSYNGTVPGTKIVVRPGDRLEVTVENRLSPYETTAWKHDHNVPHALNTTNLHLHGMDVIPHLFDPVGTSDPKASMIAIEPGETFHYTFDIPADHPSGLFWYHPHHHGSTAVQAVSGMAGVVIVEGPIDEVPEIAAARDELLVISDIGLFESDAEGEAGVWTYEPAQNAMWNTFGTAATGDLVRIWDGTAGPTGEWLNQPELHGGFTTGDYAVRFYCVDGVPFYREDHAKAGGPVPDGTPLSPKLIELHPGEVIRLRILNACSDLVLPLVLPGLEMHLIALDGVNFTAPRVLRTEEAATPTSWDGTVDYNAEAKSLVLAPANRAEMLIKAGEPGTYELVQLHHTGQQFLTAARKVIAQIVVAGEKLDMDLPTSLPEPSRYFPLIAKSELRGEHRVEFTGNFPAVQNPTVGIDFSLNGKQYEEQTINHKVPVGTSQAWILAAPEAMHHNSEGHPFHIHVNSFEVKEINGKPQPPGTIMDTLWTSGNQHNVVWMRFTEWAGKAVYHCHILPHEDTGMMANLSIEDES